MRLTDSCSMSPWLRCRTCANALAAVWAWLLAAAASTPHVHSLQIAPLLHLWLGCWLLLPSCPLPLPLLDSWHACQ
jgi:hypothetical protein